MRILFLARHAGLARNFESTLELLATRGHEVHVALDREYALSRPGREGVLDRLAAAHPTFTWGRAPARDVEGWSVLGLRLRRGLDYLRYLEPGYARANRLRARAEREAGVLLRALGRAAAHRPRARRALRRGVEAVEAAAPVSSTAAALLAEQRPELVVVSPLVELGSPQTDYVRAARAAGVPTVLCVASWDNLTNKGAVRAQPDRVTVWNEAQAREAVELHGVARERIVATGAPGYDQWFAWSASSDRASFARRVGLASDGPFLLWLGSSPFIAPREARFVLEWLRRLRRRSEPELAGVGVLIRPHPQNAAQWEEADLSGLGPVAVWPRGGADPVDAGSKRDFFDSMHHCAAVVGVNTSALIESAIVGRRVHSLLSPELREAHAGTPHFAHLAEGGLLRLAETFDEHAGQLREALRAGPGDRTRHRAFLESFVRPRGLETAATPLLVDAIEETALAPPASPGGAPAASLLRALFTPVALVVGIDARARRAARGLVRRAVRSRPLAAPARRALGSLEDPRTAGAVAPGLRGAVVRGLVAPVLAEARASLDEAPSPNGAPTPAPEVDRERAGSGT